MFYSRQKKLLSLESDRGKITALLLCIAFIPQVCIDLYLPSMPTMQNFFHTSNNYIQYTLAIYLLGSGLSQVIYGPLSDKHGRRPVILFGLWIFFISSAGCVLANNIYLLLLCRFIQGCGAASMTVSYRASIRDLYEGSQLAKIISYANMIWVTVPIIAPVIGGYIQHYANWRVSFIVIFLLSAASLLGVWKLYPETNAHLNSPDTSTDTILKKYLTLFKNIDFLIMASCAMLVNVFQLAYNMFSPFLFQIGLGLTPIKFGWTAVLAASGYLLGSTMNSQLVIRFGQKLMINLSLLLFFIGLFSLLIFSLLNVVTVPTVLIPIAIIFLASGICYPNFASGALQHFKQLAGTAGAALGLAQTGLGALLASLVTFIPHTNILGFTLYSMIVIGSIGIILLSARLYGKY